MVMIEACLHKHRFVTLRALAFPCKKGPLDSIMVDPNHASNCLSTFLALFFSFGYPYSIIIAIFVMKHASHPCSSPNFQYLLRYFYTRITLIIHMLVPFILVKKKMLFIYLNSCALISLVLRDTIVL